MRRWQSGQLQQTVNLSGIALRRFKSFPTHKSADLKVNTLRSFAVCSAEKDLKDEAGAPLGRRVG